MMMMDRVKKPKVVLLIFVSGKVVLTGAKSKDEVDVSFKKVWPILLKFKKEHRIESGHDINDQYGHNQQDDANDPNLLDMDIDDDDGEFYE